MGARFHTVKKQPVYGSTIPYEMGEVLLKVGYQDDNLSDNFHESEDGMSVEIDREGLENFIKTIDTNEIVKREVAKYESCGYSVGDFKKCCELILNECDKKSGTICLENY